MGMLSHRYACYNTYQTKDGKYVAIGAVEYLFWKRLCELLGQPDYAPLQYDEAKRHEIIDWLRRVFLTRSAEEWSQKLSSADVCFTVVHTLEEVMESDLFKEREMVAHIPREDESIHTTFGIATKLSETPGTLRSAPVPFGASTQEVLKELGYSEEKIESFKKNNIV